MRRAGEVWARVHTRRSQPVSLHVHYNQVHVQVHADADQMHATQSAVDIHTGVCSISRRRTTTSAAEPLRLQLMQLVYAAVLRCKPTIKLLTYYKVTMSSCCQISRQAIIITVFIEYLIHQGYPADGSLLSGNTSSTVKTLTIGNQQLQLLVC